MRPARPTSKDGRLDFRVKAEHKELIERAAAALGQPITTFAVSSLVQAAEKVLARETQRRLTERDRELFIAALDHEQSSPALMQAVKRYKTRRAR